jgi:hypothetical protein
MRFELSPLKSSRQYCFLPIELRLPDKAHEIFKRLRGLDRAVSLSSVPALSGRDDRAWTRESDWLPEVA